MTREQLINEVKKLRITKEEKVKEGRLKSRNKQWKIAFGPRTEGGDVPAANTGARGPSDASYMSEVRRRTTKYRCRVQGCCWREWTWGSMRRHVRECHVVGKPTTWNLFQGLKRADFEIPTTVTLRQAFDGANV